MPLRFGLIRNHYVGRTFIQPQQSIRDFGVKVKLNPVRSILEGKRVVLVDDSIVRGTTEPQDRPPGQGGGGARSARAHQLPAHRLAVLLRSGYAQPQGSDRRHAHHRRDSRIPSRPTASPISASKGLREAVGDTRNNYCTSCYTGVYPVSFPQNEEAYLQLALKAVD